VQSRRAVASISIETKTIRKVQIRIMPFIFLLYVVAFLDRVNIGFAALTMNKELAITSQEYGLLSGIFFIGYFLFEIPSNLLMHKIGARIWIARILITWGFVAALTGFVHSVHELYIVRFLLGLAEAGYAPGIILYLTYWFPPAATGEGHRAVYDGHTGCQHPGWPNFRSHTGSRALVGDQQLALASHSGGISSHRLRCSYLLPAAGPPNGGNLSCAR
jgi:hypothetical protein